MKKKKNTGIPFEHEVANIFAKTFPGAIVKHNIQEKGFKDHHQIDVIVEKSIELGITHKYLVSCKDEKNKIGIGHVREWANIVDDTINTKGIIVSKNGFTSRAANYAKQSGIEIFDLRKPDMDNFANRLREIIVTVIYATGRANLIITGSNPTPDIKLMDGRTVQALVLQDSYAIQAQDVPLELEDYCITAYFHHNEDLANGEKLNELTVVYEVKQEFDEQVVSVKDEKLDKIFRNLSKDDEEYYTTSSGGIEKLS